jgi:hypothetical protein
MTRQREAKPLYDLIIGYLNYYISIFFDSQCGRDSLKRPASKSRPFPIAPTATRCAVSPAQASSGGSACFDGRPESATAKRTATPTKTPTVSP